MGPGSALVPLAAGSLPDHLGFAVRPLVFRMTCLRFWPVLRQYSSKIGPFCRFRRLRFPQERRIGLLLKTEFDRGRIALCFTREKA